MEHATVYSALLFGTLMSPTIWSYRRQRSLMRMQRSLREYLGRAA